jgi:hypothetical protein
MTAAPLAATRPAVPPPAIWGRAGHFDGPPDFNDRFRLARAMAEDSGDMLPKPYRGKAGAVLVVIQAAMGLDIPIVTAIGHLRWEDGRSGMSAQLMHGLILRAGHSVQVLERTDKVVRMALERCDGRPGGEVEWRISEAIGAGLTSRNTWKFYPVDMLWARCLSRLARRWAPDAVHGFGYVLEEMSSLAPADEPHDLTAMDQPVDPDGNALVAPDVEELLADVDGLSVAELQDLWRRAHHGGLLTQKAGVVDGQEVTVNDVLRTLAETAQRREEQMVEAAAADAAAVATQDLTDADTVPAQRSPADSAPAGDGLLPCGCSAAEVLAPDGDHREGCDERAGARF